LAVISRRQNHRNATASSGHVRRWRKRCIFSFCSDEFGDILPSRLANDISLN